MQSTQASPKRMTIQQAEQGILRLQRRRMALNSLIRSVEEYLMVADQKDQMLDETSETTPKKPVLSVVYSRPVKQLMA
jgi:hypothetical protein